MEEINDENLISYLLNENNKFVPKIFINDIFKKLKVNYKIKNLKLFQEGLIHETYNKQSIEKKKKKLQKIL